MSGRWSTRPGAAGWLAVLDDGVSVGMLRTDVAEQAVAALAEQPAVDAHIVKVLKMARVPSPDGHATVCWFCHTSGPRQLSLLDFTQLPHLKHCIVDFPISSVRRVLHEADRRGDIG